MWPFIYKKNYPFNPRMTVPRFINIGPGVFEKKRNVKYVR